MKFFLSTAAVAVSLLVSTTVTSSSSNRRISRRSSSSSRRSALTRMLVKDSIPVDRKGGNVRRKVQEEDAEEEFEITSQYSIRFDTCVSLTAGPNVEDNKNEEQGTLLFNDDLIQYTKDGKIVNEKSYVLFSACLTDYCSYDADEQLFLIDLNTYMKVLSAYYAVDQQAHCTACSANTDYCLYVKEQEAAYASYYKESKYEAAQMAESEYAGTGYYTDTAATSSSNAYSYKNGNYQSTSSSSSSSASQSSAAYQSSNSNNYDTTGSNMYGGGYNSNGNYQQQNGYQQNYNNNNNGNPYQQSNQNNYYQQQNNQYRNGYHGNRILTTDMSAYKVLNCSKCSELLCEATADAEADANADADADVDADAADAEAADEDAITMEKVTQWIEEIADCKETGSTLLDEEIYQLYAGFMCNEDGTGIEIALFLDEECVTYTSLESWQSVASEEYDIPILPYAKTMLHFPVDHDLSCNANAQYISQEMYTLIMTGYEYNANADEGEQQQQENNEPSEFCRDLFEGGEDGEAVSLDTCQGRDNRNNDNDNSNVGHDEDGNEYVIAFQDYYFPWYTYVVTLENARESSNVCHIVHAMNGEYSYLYEPGGSWSLFHNTTTATTASSSTSNHSIFTYASYEAAVEHYAKVARDTRDQLTPEMIAIIAVVVFASIAALCCILYSCCCWSSVPNQYTQAIEDVKEKRTTSPRGGRNPHHNIAAVGSVVSAGTSYYNEPTPNNSKRERLVDAATGTLA